MYNHDRGDIFNILRCSSSLVLNCEDICWLLVAWIFDRTCLSLLSLLK